MNFRNFFPLLLMAGLSMGIAGCATSTVESRKQERYGVYSELQPAARSLVDQGKIKVGMPMDAVYIAWGKPAQVLNSESSHGARTTWLYQDTQLQEYRYWSSRPYYAYGHYFSTPTLEYDYYPRSFVRAEVNFENGVVKDWQTFAAPPN